jgi:uncharacterized protein (DUF305 family)
LATHNKALSSSSSPEQQQQNNNILASNNNINEPSSSLSMQDMTIIVEQLKEMVRTGGDAEKRRLHLGVIDELIKSHVYALEMSRAAKSACSWNKSIGREDSIIESQQQQETTMTTTTMTTTTTEVRKRMTMEEEGNETLPSHLALLDT